MSEKLTLQRALEITADMWTWLAANPLKEKHEWPPLEIVGRMRNHCACCEYVVCKYGKDKWQVRYNGMPCAEKDPKWSKQVKARSDKWLAHCPLKKLWPHGCEHPESPYAGWGAEMDIAVRAEYAMKIAEEADKELKLVNDEESS